MDLLAATIGADCDHRPPPPAAGSGRWAFVSLMIEDRGARVSAQKARVTSARQADKAAAAAAGGAPVSGVACGVAGWLPPPPEPWLARGVLNGLCILQHNATVV